MFSSEFPAVLKESRSPSKDKKQQKTTDSSPGAGNETGF